MLAHVDSFLFGLTTLEVGSVIIGIICLIISPGLSYYAVKLGDTWMRIQVIFSAACLIGAILLLFGILLKHSILVEVFVIIWFMNLIFVVIVMIFTVITNNADAFNAIIYGILYILIVGYFVIVVNSYHDSVEGKSS